MTESEGGTEVNGSNESADERGRPGSTGSNYLQVGAQIQVPFVSFCTTSKGES